MAFTEKLLTVHPPIEVAGRSIKRYHVTGDPAGIAPVIQWGTEAKLPYVDAIPGLPGEETMADIVDAPFLADLVSYQHPDHDTEEWPPQDGKSESKQ